MNAQEEEETYEIPKGPQVIKGVFDGFDAGEYGFNCKNEFGDDEILFFAKITPVVLKKYNLKDKKYIGKPFQITYTMDLEKEVDDEGNSFEIIVRSITELKQL